MKHVAPHSQVSEKIVPAFSRWKVRRHGVFVDVGSDMQFNSLYCVVVSLYLLMNRNDHPATSEDALAAPAIRATRIIMNGDRTAFFNPGTAEPVRAVSHKV
jgi:hypothetical protein